MKTTLIIDSHKGSTAEPTNNLHWRNARTLATALDADLIWSYPGVNDAVRGGYARIVFVHASPYAYTDYAWLTASPNAELFYLTNEYNLGEPRTLWMAAKRAQRHYTVIANHAPEPSKIVKKYVKAWKQVNLNALCMQLPIQTTQPRTGCVYYGSFRKDRTASFQKYLTAGQVTISTHVKNRSKFAAIGVSGPFIGRLDIPAGDLARFATSLYIEDGVTHTNYNHLANRFYEALSHGVCPVFDETCRETLRLSGYRDATIIDSVADIPANPVIPSEWVADALEESAAALISCCDIVLSKGRSMVSVELAQELQVGIV